MINAEYKSEERYSKLSLVFDTKEEEDRVNTVINVVIDENSFKPEIYSCELPKNKKVIVIEYHDDCDRSSGPIFDKIMKTLGISRC